MVLFSKDNTQCITVGYWGWVEFATAATSVQSEGTQLAVDGYTLQLTPAPLPAPPYAARDLALSSSNSSLDEGAKPQYVHATHAQTAAVPGGVQTPVTGAVQYQYPNYDYSAYGYGAGAYGK